MDPKDVFWRLEYANGRSIVEPPEGWSIRNGEPGAQGLVLYERLGELTDPRARAFAAVNLSLPDGFNIPIFYRRWGITLDGGGPQVDAVVFGRAKVVDGKASATLWMVTKESGRMVDCSPEHADPQAVEVITGAFV
jgi:hypothetical protein